LISEVIVSAASHLVQIDRPATDVYLPLGHRAHAALPLVSLYFPSGHAVHAATPSSAPVCPGGQNRWHAAGDELPTGEVGVLAGQPRQ
jgi:hypothetical protein